MLHVGYAKTGSSYLQSLFALNTDYLLQNGIFYPDHPSLPKAKLGLITSGNITGKNKLQTISNYLSVPSPGSAVLFSSEGLFEEIRDSGALVQQLSRAHEISILIYIRNPIDHIMSVYGQKVKRQGFTGEITELIDKYKTPRALRAFHTHASPFAQICYINYSNDRDIVRSSAHFLGCDPDRLVLPPSGNVNRSLTRSELYLQIAVNLYFADRNPSTVADALCELLPDIAGLPQDKLSMNLSEISRLKDKCESDIQIMNSLLPSSAQLSLDHHSSSVVDSKEEGLSFSRQQIDAVINALSRMKSAA